MATILVGLHRVASEFKSTDKDVFGSSSLNNILQLLPTIKDQVKEFLDAINVKEAKNDNEANLWNDMDKYLEIQDAKDVSGRCAAMIASSNA